MWRTPPTAALPTPRAGIFAFWRPREATQTMATAHLAVLMEPLHPGNPAQGNSAPLLFFPSALTSPEPTPQDKYPKPWSSSPSWPSRSEEHTSELQSRQYLVCRLLLEKN